jgi:hypothetical protein
VSLRIRTKADDDDDDELAIATYDGIIATTSIMFESDDM